MILPIYIGQGYLYDDETDTYRMRWVVARFDPIPTKERVLESGLRKGVLGSDVAAIWVKTPPLSRVAETPVILRSWRAIGDDGRECWQHRWGSSKVLLLAGEATSGLSAWVILALARAGDALYRIVDTPPTLAPISVAPAAGLVVDIYAARLSVVALDRHRRLLAWESMSFAPIAAAEWEATPGLRHVQEACPRPAYRVAVPATARVIGPTLRMAEGDPPPWWSPEQLAYRAAVGASGLSLLPGSGDPRARRINLPPGGEPLERVEDSTPVDAWQLAFAWAS